MHPVQRLVDYDDWALDFKSIRIARKAVESMGSEGDEQLWKTYDRIHNMSKSSALAGWLFEAIIHRVLSLGWRLGGHTPQPIRMVSDGRDPPAFSTDRSSLSSSTPDISLSFPATIRAGTRALALVNFIHRLSNVTLDENKYYIPTAATDFLFDSFTIDLDLDRNTAVIYVFQITTSPKYEEPAHGFPHGPCTRASRGGGP